MVTMQTTAQVTIGDCVDSYRRHLSNVASPNTVRVYVQGVEQLQGYLSTMGMPVVVANIRAEHVEMFLKDQRERLSAATAATRHMALRRFFGWLQEQSEITTSPMARLSPPKVTAPVVEILSTDDLRRLLAAAKGRGFEERRDYATLRLFLDTGLRVSEMAGIRLDALDLDDRTLRVTGKGDKKRTVYLGKKSVEAIDAYLRARRRRPHADSPMLWLSSKGPLTVSGVRQAVQRSGRQAGLGAIWPHQLRHTFCHDWLMAGKSEGALVRQAGWSGRKMLARYAAAGADSRAKEEHRQFSPGDAI